MDGSKACDNVFDRLVLPLSCFGVLEKYCTLIRLAYSNRHFVVHDVGVRNDVHQHYFGISQNRPLSPILFSIVMTVVRNQASGISPDHSACVKMTDGRFLKELVYAGDTMVTIHPDACAERY